MIKKMIFVALLISSHIVVSADFESNLVSGIEEILDNAAEEQKYPGVSLAIAYRDHSYSDQRGYADVAEQKDVDDKTIFRMYSLTKGVTGILAAILVEQGRLDMNAPISKYLPDLPDHIKPITSQQLLEHKGGIRHYRSNDEWLDLSQNRCSSPQEAFAPFISDPLAFEPGSEVKYSSFGYVLLSAVLEAAGGKSFEELMYKYVLSPAGTARIEFDNPEKNTRLNVTRFYEPANDQYFEAPSINNSCKFGGGSINATPTDMAMIFNAYFSGDLTAQDSSAIAALPERIGMGGEGLGGRSALIAYPDENLTVVMVANARGGDLQPYAVEISELILEQLAR